MTAAQPAHRWRFFRSGGFDQLRIETVEDLRALPQLDLKLWASLACPTTGLDFDTRTLKYIDGDDDGRIRAPEILGAVQWALARLSKPEILFASPGLPLSAISTETPEGARLHRSAQRVLTNLGKPQDALLTSADTTDLAALFPPGQLNGDGLVPASLAPDSALRQLIEDIVAAFGSKSDRSGDPGVSAEDIQTFFEQAQALLSWRDRTTTERDALMPLGDATDDAIAAYSAVAAKIDDYFMRVQFAAYDARAAALMNGTEDDLVQLSTQALTASSEQARRMPLAQIRAGAALPLGDGVNPAWVAPMQTFRTRVVAPLLGERSELTSADWQQLRSRLAPHLEWSAEKPATSLENIPDERLRGYVVRDDRQRLQTLVDQDKAVEEESGDTLDVDRLIRYQHYLVKLLNNFVALREFYTRRDGIFQAGRLYLDGRSFDLCLPVANAGKHAALAELSRTYLAYCDCTHKRSGDKMTIVAAVTAGSAGNLMAGRNGIFYDRSGQDWDATITKIVQNPVSLRDAFWSPYRRIGKLVSDQVQKLAASREEAVNTQAAAQVATPTPSSFDIGKFVGIFAAIGLALGAIGSAFALVITGLLGMPWWKLPLIAVAVVLLISGPSVVLAWFKLRGRNLAPILDANGWAVNTEAKINIPFGTALTRLAHLPKNAERALNDPYAEKNHAPRLLLVACLLAALATYGAWRAGWISFGPSVSSTAAQETTPAP